MKFVNQDRQDRDKQASLLRSRSLSVLLLRGARSIRGAILLSGLGHENGTEPLQPLGRRLQARSHDGLAAGDVSISSGPSALHLVRVHQMLPAVAHQPERALHVRRNPAAVDGVGLFLDDGEPAIDAVQALVAQRVDFCEVGRERLEVAEHGFCEFGVALVGSVEGHLAVAGAAEGGDGLGDDGVGGEVLQTERWKSAGALLFMVY